MSATQIDVSTDNYKVEVAELAGGLVVRVHRKDECNVHLVEGNSGEMPDSPNFDIGESGSVIEVYFS